MSLVGAAHPEIGLRGRLRPPAGWRTDAFHAFEERPVVSRGGNPQKRKERKTKKHKEKRTGIATPAVSPAEKRKERTGIATPDVSLWAEAVRNPILFSAKRFNSAGNSWASLIPLSRAAEFSSLDRSMSQGRLAAEAIVAR